jgi:hypothetical protein
VDWLRQSWRVRARLLVTLLEGRWANARSGKEFWDRSVVAPVGGHRSQAPVISRGIQAYSHGPIPTITARGNIAGHPGGDATSPGQALNPESQSWLQRVAKANATTVGIHEKRVTVLGNRTIRIKTDQAQRNLCPYSSAKPPLEEIGQPIAHCMPNSGPGVSLSDHSTSKIRDTSNVDTGLHLVADNRLTVAVDRPFAACPY